MIAFLKTYFSVCLIVLFACCAVAACIKTVNEKYPDNEKDRKQIYGIIICILSLIISVFVYNPQ